MRDDTLFYILKNIKAGDRWPCGGTFDYRSRGPWFESYTGLT